MLAKLQSTRFANNKAQGRAGNAALMLDPVLLLALVTITGLGLVVMTSASVASAERLYGDAFYFLYRQSTYLLAGLLLALLSWRLPLRYWQAMAPLFLLFTFLLLIAVLIPGVGKTVNGSSRWIALGVINLQVSELIKLVMVLYMASFLARHNERVKDSLGGFLVPVLVLSLVGVLLLAEPDFGSTVVVATVTLGMLFIAGVRVSHFMFLFVLMAGAMLALAKAAPYRWERVMTFLNPWEDPFNSGFQLSQSLIAFGRGEWAGVGLGASVQKLFYLPEAHTDFVFAILAEELGFIGAIITIGLFAVVAWRAMRIARAAQVSGNLFGAYLAYGIGLWFVFQAYVNIGVNMGVLPTKGLTLPFMSYGGSSLIVCILASLLLLRVDYETQQAKSAGDKR